MSAAAGPEPPRLAEKLLRRCLPADVAGRSIVGDLREEYREYAAKPAAIPPIAWYWIQALRVCAWQLRREAVGEKTTMNGTLHDLRNGLRGLVRRPAFTGLVVLTLALGIAATTAVFSVVHAVVLQPLPYGDPDELVVVWYRLGDGRTDRVPMSPPDFLDFQDHIEGLTGLAAVSRFDATISDDSGAERIVAVNGTPNLFSLLGVSPALGRDFVADDATPIPPQAFEDPGVPLPPGAVILSHGYWERRFGADPEVVGSTLRMNGRVHEIVGVAPPDFRIFLPAEMGMGGDVAVWSTFSFDFAQASRRSVFLRVVGRLAPGATVARVQEEVGALTASFREEHFSHRAADVHGRVGVLHDEVTGDVEGTLMALLGAVGLVLMIACANVANLLLGRSAIRQQELAVRSALGAGRGRLLRQLLIESGLVAIAAGVVGVALGALGIELLLALQPQDLPRIEDVGLNLPVVGFALGITLLSAIVFGAAPAFAGALPAPRGAMGIRSTGGAPGSRPGAQRLRNGLVVLEVALSLVLLVGTGLVLRSFTVLRTVDPGFSADGVVTFRVDLPGLEYPEPEDEWLFFSELRNRLEGIPGVAAAGAVARIPLGSAPGMISYRIDDEPDDSEDSHEGNMQPVLHGFLEAIGARLVDGRLLTADDLRDGSRVAVIDDVLAQRWPGESAVGRTIKARLTPPGGGDPVTTRWEVVGVVRHVRHRSLDRDGRPAFFIPWTTSPQGQLTFVARTDGAPAALSARVREIVGQIDADVPVFDVRLLDSYVGEALAPATFLLTLVGIFGSSALVLALVGLYGVVSYWVRRQTREIGVRMALGAEPGAIVRRVIRSGMGMVALGIGFGILGSYWLGRGLQGALVGVEPGDPATTAITAAALTAMCLIAVLIPAWRAARIDPVDSLRLDS